MSYASWLLDQERTRAVEAEEMLEQLRARVMELEGELDAAARLVGYWSDNAYEWQLRTARWKAAAKRWRLEYKREEDLRERDNGPRPLYNGWSAEPLVVDVNWSRCAYCGGNGLTCTAQCAP